MPGKCRLKLLTNSYQKMRTSHTPAVDWDSSTVNCRECGKDMRASLLNRYLADLHEIYQQQVVANELLERQKGEVYKFPLGCGKLICLFPLCKGGLVDGWMMQRQFWDLHPLDFVVDNLSRRK